MKIGSPEHRDTFCKQFMQTYTEFNPDTLPWPDLDEAALQRLKSVPFWKRSSIPSAAPVRSSRSSSRPSKIR